MRIAQVAPMYEAVPPHRYGGTERVVSYLTEELVRRGHDVTLFASGDSRTAAKLVPTSAAALRERFTLQEMREVAPPLHLAMMGEVLQRADEFDVIHSHVDYFPWAFAPFVRSPMITTMHGRLDVAYWPPLIERFPKTPLVSISHHQRAPLAALHPHWAGTVYNGIPVNEFPFNAKPGDYFLFLGRIAVEKRPDWAVEIARRTGIKLKVAAKIDPYDQEYFDREIKHLFDDPLVEFLGEVDEQEKRKLLAGAYALMFPIDWPEPFGLVMIESLACGTPVVAFRGGSVAEVIEHGVTGFVVDDMDQAIDAASRVHTLDRRACRDAFRRRFSASRMASGYVRLYRQLASSAAGANIVA
jgi:glycosyltransferase involved in cell wall biosynthesis